MDVGFNKTKTYKGTEITIFHKTVPNNRAAMAIELITRWGLVAAIPDGEDTAGRSKLALMPIYELVNRACETADAAYYEFEKRGWILHIPDPVFDDD